MFLQFLQFVCVFILPNAICGLSKWFAGKTPQDLLVFWLWFAPPRGSWPKETIGNSARTPKNFRNLWILKKFLRFFENLVSFLAFHFTDCHSSPNEMIFMKKSIRFAGFLAVIFTSERKNLQKFMHSEKMEIFWKFCTFFVFKSYYRTRRLGVVRGSDFLKNPPDLLVFLLWFSPSSEKIFSNLCILKKLWRFLCCCCCCCGCGCGCDFGKGLGG